MKVAVLGNGGFGTAMAMVASQAGNEVRLWGHDPVYTAEIAATRQNPRYLEDVTVPDAISVSADAAYVLCDAEVVLVAVPTQHLRETMQRLAAEVPQGAALVSLSKGLEQKFAARPSDVLRDVMREASRECSVYVLSGPSHAEEIAHGKPATVVLAGGDDRGIVVLQQALSSPSFRIYRNPDMLGTELCGALKNVMALAAGIADGLGYGDNAKAAILSRGIVEMARYGVAAGAKQETFYGLAGVGDLAVTAFSRHGRNRAFGERIGRGQTLDEILQSTHKVAEGVWTSRVVRDEAAKQGLDLPLSAAVAAVLFDGLDPKAAVQVLMERDAKAEWSESLNL